jgi:hypothetical protein
MRASSICGISTMASVNALATRLNVDGLCLVIGRDRNKIATGASLTTFGPEFQGRQRIARRPSVRLETAALPVASSQARNIQAVLQ